MIPEKFFENEMSSFVSNTPKINLLEFFNQKIFDKISLRAWIDLFIILEVNMITARNSSFEMLLLYSITNFLGPPRKFQQLRKMI